MKRKIFRKVLWLLIALFTIAGVNPPAYAAPGDMIELGQSVSTADGFTVQITNFDASANYNFFGIPVGSASLNTSTGLITVSGLRPDESSEFGINTIPATYAANHAFGKALKEALAVTLQTPRAFDNSIEVVAQNIDPNFTYTATTSAGVVSVEISSFYAIAIARVTGLADAQTATVTVYASKEGHATGSASISGTSRRTGRVADISEIVQTNNGFYFQIRNFNLQEASLGFGIVGDAPSQDFRYDSDATGRITVTGMSVGQSVTIQVSLGLYDIAFTRPVVLVSYTMQPAPDPVVNAVAIPSAGSAFITWGISNGATSYRVTSTPGNFTCTNTQNFCTISGLTNGTSYTFSVVASKNGLLSTPVVTAPERIGSQLEVSGALTSASWKVGATVVANPLIVGQYSILRYNWYRCDQAVPVSAAPPTCTALNETSNTYTLQAADVGKFVTAHLHVTGGAGVVTATISNAVAALAANASTVPTDPNGKPLVLEIPKNEVPALTGGQITINGSGFTGVTSVTVDGVLATIISASDTALVISIPAAKTAGLVDISITTPKGTATVASALAYTITPVTPTPGTNTPGTGIPTASKPVTKKLTAFTGTVTALSAKQKSEIAAFLIANPNLAKLQCNAVTTGVKKSSTEAKAAAKRATASCAYAVSLKKSLFIQSSGKQGVTTGKVSKVVSLTLGN